jgi:hypothetical protein
MGDMVVVVVRLAYFGLGLNVPIYARVIMWCVGASGARQAEVGRGVAGHSGELGLERVGVHGRGGVIDPAGV